MASISTNASGQTKANAQNLGDIIITVSKYIVSLFAYGLAAATTPQTASGRVNFNGIQFMSGELQDKIMTVHFLDAADEHASGTFKV